MICGIDAGLLWRGYTYRYIHRTDQEGLCLGGSALSAEQTRVAMTMAILISDRRPHATC